MVNVMSDKQLLKTIQNDIKNIDKCIDMCIDEEGIDYLKSIQKHMRMEEIKLIKQIAIKKESSILNNIFLYNLPNL